MSDRPINPDREQQRADNEASRRQSGLEPLPRDREEDTGEETGEGRGRERGGGAKDEVRRRVELASGGEPATGLAAEREGPSAGPERGGSSRGARADEATAAAREEQTRRTERIQQAGEGIHGVSTHGREDQDAEDEIRRTAEGTDEGEEGDRTG